ncbi:unnamed protein product [Cuscuta campestris]|uniref:Integrase catalytic domain-containing protein n=1 Tax=Cuscuta campestris TaxID=132261 RepID=A0A484LL19_9ASTE|nr:unnamed protein product [Cuscuta campestris]
MELKQQWARKRNEVPAQFIGEGGGNGQRSSKASAYVVHFDDLVEVKVSVTLVLPCMVEYHIPCRTEVMEKVVDCKGSYFLWPKSLVGLRKALVPPLARALFRQANILPLSTITPLLPALPFRTLLSEVLRTASSPILQELHDPEEVERERQAIARRWAEEIAWNNRANGDRTRAMSQVIGNGNENPRVTVFERISHQRAHVSERLGKNPDKAPQGWVRPQASQMASSNREPRQRAGRGGSQAPIRSLVVLDEEKFKAKSGSQHRNVWGHQIQEMQRKINRGRVFTTRTNTSLAPEIFAEPYPQRFNMPFVKCYDGESDPQEHINSYVQVMCRCFLQTVDSKVADWVNHIPAGSIQTWDELGLRFLEHFAGNCRPKKHFTHLASVRQKHGESLKNFLTRWRKELIRQGHLKKFVQDGDGGNPRNAQNGKRRDGQVAQAEAREKRHIGLEDEEEDSEAAPHRQKRHHGCNFIIGGNTSGDSATSWKKWANTAIVNKVVAPEGKKLKTEPIVFSNADLPEIGVPHRDALVITIDIMDLLIHKTLVDTGSSVNIMYMDTYKALGLTRDELLPIKTPLTGFRGDSIEPEGVITLPVEIGDTKATRKLDMEFIIVGIISNTNIILGRPGLEDLECVISPHHLCIKFPTPHGVGIARGSQRVYRAWYLKATKQPIKYDTQVGEVTTQLLRAEERRPRVEVACDIEEVELEPGTPGRLVRIGKDLGDELRSWVISVLRRFRKVFAWSPADMPGLDHKIAVHRLNVLRDAKPEERMKRYRDLSLEMLGRFEFKLEHIPRAHNAEVDVLSKLSAESPEYISKLATVEELATPSLNRDDVLWVSADLPEWLDKLARYIEDGVAPEDSQEARLLRMRAPTYKVQDGILYKRSYNGVLLCCLRLAEAKALVEEIHEVVCAAHQGSYSISRRAIIQGYFWPTMRKDCEEWGIDIVGALSKGVGQARWIVVAIDYFTKWVEAEPLAGITGKQMIDFVGTSILCRFGVPKQIISENGTQFEETEFQDFLKTWGISIQRTTPSRATGDTPFGLAYGFEARAPAETVIPTRRETEYDPEVNEQNQAIELNFVEERRDEARIQAENYRRQVKSYFDSRVKPWAFQVGDYVLRKREKSQPTKGGKLAKKYEGPYIIKAVVRPGRTANRLRGLKLSIPPAQINRANKL